MTQKLESKVEEKWLVGVTITSWNWWTIKLDAFALITVLYITDKLQLRYRRLTKDQLIVVAEPISRNG